MSRQRPGRDAQSAPGLTNIQKADLGQHDRTFICSDELSRAILAIMKLAVIPFLAFCVAAFALNLRAADTNALTLGKTIVLPGISGRIDHFAIDVEGHRLFVAALGNNTVEALDLESGQRLQSITGCSEPQGLAFVPVANRLFIANGGAGTVEMLDGTTFKTLGTVGDLPDADNMRYDAGANLIYAGYGEGGLAVISATNGSLIATIPLAAHPESFQLEKTGSRIFVNVPDARQIAVVDRNKRKVLTTWPMEEFRANFPMALDEVNHRLFIGTRHPARLLILDTMSGKKAGDVEISGDTDDLFYDGSRKRIYVSCGSGFLDVVEQRGAESYTLCQQLATASGARTSFFSPERDELYLAVRAGMISRNAEIRVYHPQN
jgi:DNA-binding beta-propeller fold protein YncE